MPTPSERLPVKMLNDRILVEMPDKWRTALIWRNLIQQQCKYLKISSAEVKATGPNVRTMEIGDQVLFNPEDRYEVKLEEMIT